MEVKLNPRRSDLLCGSFRSGFKSCGKVLGTADMTIKDVVIKIALYVNRFQRTVFSELHSYATTKFPIYDTFADLNEAVLFHPRQRLLRQSSQP